MKRCVKTIFVAFLMFLMTSSYSWAQETHSVPHPDNGKIPVNTVDSARRLINDLIATYGEQYPDGKALLDELSGIETKLTANPDDGEAKNALSSLIRRASLANPLLSFDKIAVVRRNPAHGWGFPGLNAYTNDTITRTGWDCSLSFVSNFKTADPKEAKIEPFYKHYNDGIIRDLELSFDAKRMLFTSINKNGQWAIFEVGLDGSNLREMTPTDQPDVSWFDACYLPEEPYIVSASTAGIQGLPCEGGGRVMANLYRVNTDTKKVRQLTFEQDSDWHPTVMKNGQVLYLRWEYTDVPHYFSRYVFSMNPDGRNQRALYGSGSYFPTAYKHARQCPEASSTKLIGVVGGHHAEPEVGRLLIIDPNMGRDYPMRFRPTSKEWGPENTEINIIPDILPKEVTGCVQEIPGWGRDVVGNVCDDQARHSTYKFVYPFPLSDKYFIVNMSMPGHGTYGLWLVDIFDNMTLLAELPQESLFEPFPVQARTKPPVLADNVDMSQDSGYVFLQNVYLGRGTKDIPKGKAKKLRIFAYHFGYLGSGGHESVGRESSWDIKRILGTVDIEEDGSAAFQVPANTPFAMQVLDEDGAALALMRSWTIVQPGEALSCNGCHETAHDVTPVQLSIASRKAPQKIKEWYGPARSWGFQTELQPVLNQYCVACHNDTDRKGDISFIPNGAGDWRSDQAYTELVRFARHPGPEDELETLRPMEYHASTSELIQILRRGHHNVKLSPEAWDRFYTWIDLNAPYVGMWNNPPRESRRLELQKLYANISTNPEEEYRIAMRERQMNIEPIMPEPEQPMEPDNLTVEPFKVSGNVEKMTLSVGKDYFGNEVSMTFVKVPAGKYIMGSQDGYADEAPRAVVAISRPFWMSETEVTNQQYECFDPSHDTRYLHENGKDHTLPGYIANHPQQPVARISWNEAQKFCAWFSKQSQRKVELPTEAQWEWAARGGQGSDQAFFFGAKDADWTNWANLADHGLQRTYTSWDGGSKIHARRDFPAESKYPLRDDRFTDKYFSVDYVKQYAPNPFGLYDMIGNVSEWTRSDYKAYPYVDNDGRNACNVAEKKVTRGGSWNNRPVSATSSVRVPYDSYQKVYNVGFRVIIEE